MLAKVNLPIKLTLSLSRSKSMTRFSLCRKLSIKLLQSLTGDDLKIIYWTVQRKLTWLICSPTPIVEAMVTFFIKEPLTVSGLLLDTEE